MKLHGMGAETKIMVPVPPETWQLVGSETVPQDGSQDVVKKGRLIFWDNHRIGSWENLQESPR